MKERARQQADRASLPAGWPKGRSLAVSVPYIMAACYAGMNIEECGT